MVQPLCQMSEMKVPYTLSPSQGPYPREVLRPYGLRETPLVGSLDSLALNAPRPRRPPERRWIHTRPRGMPWTRFWTSEIPFLASCGYPG